LDAAAEEIREFAETHEPVATPDMEGGFMKQARPNFDVNDMDRANFGDLADRGWITTESPLADQDALSGAEDGALAVVQGESGSEVVFPSNNLNVTESAGYTKGVSVIGPYRVEARLVNNGDRKIKVENTR
jgi:hypothetical protein